MHDIKKNTKTLLKILKSKNNRTDWNKTKIRCSSLGVLFTEPQSKADKDAGLLSKTAQTHFN